MLTLRVRAARKLPLKISLVQNMPQKAQEPLPGMVLAVWHEAVVQTTIQANLVLQNRKSVEAVILFAGVSYPTVARWFPLSREPARRCNNARRLNPSRRKGFSKLKSKQATYIVTGATEQDTGRLALRITGVSMTDEAKMCLSSSSRQRKTRQPNYYRQMVRLRRITAPRLRA